MTQLKGLRSVGLFVLFLVAFVFFGCGLDIDDGFVPAPPPVIAHDVMNIHQVAIKDAQIMSVTSPLLEVTYKQNGNGAGQTATETIELPNGEEATMLSVVWGDWEKASIDIINYYRPDGSLVAGTIVASFDEISLFQLISNPDRIMDRSTVTLIYQDSGDSVMKLQSMQYAEQWGPTSGNVLALGGYAMWYKNLDQILPAEYMQWGFWETNGTPANQVSELLRATMAADANGVSPDFKAVDYDSGREIIGRQTGLVLEASGYSYGNIEFQYSELFGRGPNNVFISDGALTDVVWRLRDQTYYLVVLSPRLSPVGSAVYVFTTSEKTATLLSNDMYRQNPAQLYDELHSNEYEGVFFAAYGMGDIGLMTDSNTEGTVDIGDEGGVRWQTLGEVTYENVLLASELLALLGPAQRNTGFYYAYANGSGSGLNYYLGVLRLSYAPSDTVLTTFGQDVGVLDRVTIPDINLFVNP